LRALGRWQRSRALLQQLVHARTTIDRIVARFLAIRDARFTHRSHAHMHTFVASCSTNCKMSQYKICAHVTPRGSHLPMNALEARTISPCPCASAILSARGCMSDSGDTHGCYGFYDELTTVYVLIASYVRPGVHSRSAALGTHRRNPCSGCMWQQVLAISRSWTSRAPCTYAGLIKFHQ
jgi:hypothetical protein